MEHGNHGDKSQQPTTKSCLEPSPSFENFRSLLMPNEASAEKLYHDYCDKVKVVMTSTEETPGQVVLPNQQRFKERLSKPS